MPIINGTPYSWASFAVALNGTRYYQIQSASFKNSMEHSDLRGTGQGVFGVTKGQHSADASVEMGASDAFAFRADLGDGYMNVRFPVTLTYGADDGSDSHAVTFTASLKEDSWDGSQDTKATTFKLPFKVIGRISVDGLDPIGSASA